MHARNVIRRSTLLLAGCLVSSAAMSAAADGPRKNFVSCPIVRDTASVPCWLAEYEGQLYYLTIQSDVTSPVTPPWLGHRVLVEGTVSNEPNICGGVVLKPVHLSVMPEPDASCNTMLPAEARYNLTFEPPRPPGPSKGRLAFDNAPPPAAKASPAALPPTREFVVPYDFDALVGFNHARVLTDILEFGRAVNAREIEIVGYRGAARLSNGQVMLEEAEIGKRRAEQLSMLLQGANLKSPSYTVTSRDESARATGADDYAIRRAVVTVRAGSGAAQSPALPSDINAESLSRLPVVARESLDAEGKRIYDYIGGRGGPPPKTGPGGVSLHSPASAEAIQMLNQSLRKTVIGAKYFEISALAAAREFDQQYEWSGHEPGALRAGVDQAAIDAIKFDRDVAGLEEKSATVILMGRQLFRGNHQLNAELWAKAVRLFGTQGALEITVVMGDYAMAAVMLNAVNQQLPPGRPALLPTRR